MKKESEVLDIVCNHYVESVTKACKPANGVTDVDVSLENKKVVVEEGFNEADIIKIIDEISSEAILK